MRYGEGDAPRIRSQMDGRRLVYRRKEQLMNEQDSASEAQRAQLTSHLEELEQEIAQKEEEIRALEQHQAGATVQPQEGVHGQLSMAQQTRDAMLKNVDVIHAQLARPAVPSSSAQPQQPRGAHIYPSNPRR